MAYPIYNAPTPEEQEYARRLKMAEALRAGSPNMQGQMVSGHYIGPSWTQGLEKLFRGYSAGKTEREAEQGLKDWQTQGQQSMEGLTKMLSDPLTTDEARNAALMGHTQRYGRAGIDTYLAAINAATQAQNARTAQAKLDKERKDKEADAKAMRVAFEHMLPGIRFEGDGEDFRLMPISAPVPNGTGGFTMDDQQLAQALGQSLEPLPGGYMPQLPEKKPYDERYARLFGIPGEDLQVIAEIGMSNPKMGDYLIRKAWEKRLKGGVSGTKINFDDAMESIAAGVPVEGYNYTPDQAAKILASSSSRKKPLVSISNVMPGEAAEAAGRKEGFEIGDQAAAIENKYSAIDSIREARGMLESGIYAGFWGPKVQKMAKITGGLIGDMPTVVRTEKYMSYIGNVVIPRLKEFGGNDSVEELRYLQNVMAGNQELEPESLDGILQSAEIKIQRGIERLQRQRASLERGQMPDLGPGPARGQKEKTKVTPLPKTAPSVDDLLKKYGGK